MKRPLLIALLLLAAAIVAAVSWFARVDAPAARPGQLAASPAPLSPTPAEPQAALGGAAPADTREPATASEPGLDAVAREREAVVSTTASSGQSLSARLVSQRGPVGGAEVVLMDADGRELARDTSDATGKFFLALPEPVDAGTLRATKAQFAPLVRVGERVRANQRTFLGTLRMEAGAQVLVEVVSAAGAPVPRAHVELRASGPAGLIGRSLAVAEADAQGRAHFDDAPSSALRIEASAAGYGARAVDGVRPQADQPVRVELAAERQLELRVEARGGAPLAGARVELAPLDPGAPGREARSDERGIALLRGLGADSWGARVSADGYRTRTELRIQVGTNEPIVLDPWPCLRGRVSVRGGGAVPEGTEALLRATDARGQLTDGAIRARGPVAEGAYRLCDLRPGVYVVEVRAPGFAPSRSSSFQVRLDVDELSIDLELEEGGRLSVRALGTQGSIAEAEVWALIAPAQAFELQQGEFGAGSPLKQPLAQARTGADGRALLERLPRGPVFVAVSAPGYLPAIKGPYELESGQRALEVDADLERGGFLAGTVLDASGRGLAGALVTFRSTGKGPGAPLRTTADANGRYQSPVLAPGNYRVVARNLAGLASGERSVEAEGQVERGSTAALDLRIDAP